MLEPHLSFGAWVARLRKAQDLTQAALADRVGCSVSALRKIEADERRPSREVAELLAAALELPLDQRPHFLKVARRDPGALREAIASVPGPVSAAHAVPERLATPIPEIPPQAPPPDLLLPAPSTPLVGRDQERATLAALLRDPACRLVTLVGPGGIGKTRLALQVAADQQPLLHDGVFFLELSALTAPHRLAATIAGAVGCVIHGVDEAAAQLLRFLRSRELLLVLDNLEHLLDGVDLLADLLQQAPGLRILATSRERLNLQGEWVFEVEGLPIPPPESGASGLASESYSAVRLFLQSAQRARVGFLPSADDRAAITRICRLVDGLPLAIELAAGWVRILSCTEIADEIERDLHFLASTARDIPQRHRSITAVFDQSWLLLEERERAVLRRLAVFRGGFEREAAEEVAAATLPILSSLVARSLVRRSGPHRYDLHELVRQYCAEQLAAAGETESVRAAHAQAMRTLMRATRLHLVGPEQRTWLDRTEAELNNLRAALEWSHGAGALAVGLEIAVALVGFWYQRDYQSEGCQWLLTLIEMAGPESQTAGPESQTAGPEIDPALLIDALNSAGYLAYELGNFEGARAQLERALALLRRQPNSNLLANTLVVLGQVYGSLGDYARAGQTLEEALALAQDDVYARRRRGSALMALADVTSLSGDDDHAQFVYAASAAIYRDIGDANALAYALRKWGWSALRCGDLEQADALTRESLSLNQQTQSKIGSIACLAALAALHAHRTEHAAAARILAAVESLMERHAVRLRPMDQIGYTRTLALLHAALTEAEQAAATAAGRAWSLDQAIAAALA